MKIWNTVLAATLLTMLAAAGCATLDSAKAEQEEIITQIQKEQATSPVPQEPGRWVDANGWENDVLTDGD
jgi:ABC-type Fe3+-citrate transport system substrate-binding protein